MRYIVRSDFAMFGDPCEERFDTSEAAEAAAQEAARAIMDSFYPKMANGRRMVQDEPGNGGDSKEVEWGREMAEDCTDEGGIWSVDEATLLAHVRKAISIEQG